jgi:levanase/fructan beta-fructosidase
MKKAKIIIAVFMAMALNSFAQTTIPTPQWRPVYHFSPPTNWTNDPNGLVFLNGEFQLYYQHNPFENKWGHMSWGHATSKDLVHWKNFPVAIPEIVSKDTTTWIFSGSAVLDKNNTSGFGVNGKAPLVAIFTGDQPKQHKESQFIAYSNDGGMSFTQYAKNPVIDLNKSDFRDPNVFWYAPTKQWIMTVSMVNEHMVRIYGSKNLKEWTKLSDFGPAGFTKNGWECPSMLPLVVDNNPAKIKWILFVSSGGGHGPLIQYFVGDFDGTTFKNDNPDDKVLTVDYGDAFYAAIAWRDAPGNRKIWLGWLQNGRVETSPWKGQMAIPRDLSFKTTPEGIRLTQPPSTVISGLLSKLAGKYMLSEKDVKIDNKAISLTKNGRFGSNANWIDAEINLNDSKNAGFNIVEKKDANGNVIKKVVVGYDVDKEELYVDCSGAEKEHKLAENLVLSAPMKPVNGIVRIQVLLDKSSLEVIGNGGEKVISTMIYPDTDATGMSAFADGKAMLNNLKIWDMSKD